MDALTAMREAEIRALDLIGRAVPDVLQRLVRIAAEVTGAAVAEIHVITATSQHTLVSTGTMPDPCPVGDSYCARIVREPEREHLVPDVRVDDRFKDSPFTTSGAVVTYAASQLVTSGGTPIGTLCVFDPARRELDASAMAVLSELSAATIDVLEGRQHGESLEESLVTLADGQRELRRSNEHLAAFAGQVSHDIQGPLAAVLMSLQLMEEQQDPEASPDQDMLLRRALSGAHRMRATVGGLMEFAVVGGRLVLDRLDMESVVAEVLQDLGARLGRSQIEVGVLPKVWGDDVQVRAVTQNLVANALKYGARVPDPVVHVTGTSDGRAARISVSDNGPGVPEDQHESIFELLVRGDGASESGVDGLGIGLATCRRIIEAHGGDIGVREAPGGGAEFWFELPVPDSGD